ncbi:DUF6259 domain-containing protein [Jiangella endophytica]|uniref:DUF6259 domain-containing protein n=1 Tax=Jiangella endophytica TaxID=1623398 RepID=UPI0013001B0D|nr:DUF6259 domain-containing protein [Jiangella endophytica]
MASTDSHHVAGGLLTFHIDENGGGASFSAGGLRTAPRSRFWTLSVQHGEHRDCPVHSEEQRGHVAATAEGVRISYSALRAACGADLEVALEVRVTGRDDELEFEARGRASGGVLVRETALPVIELAAGGDVDEALYRPEGLGRRVPEPRTRLYRAHTEYMTDDSAGVWESIAYPGELSMPWQGLETGAGFLYLGRHDPEFSSVLLCAGVPPRGQAGELWLSAVTPSGRDEFGAGPVVVALLPGWRDGAARYRAWADRWYTGPHPDTEPLEGWQRIIMRHQFGEVYFRYTDLVDVFEEGRRHGLDGILLFGWWRGGFDRGYPVYEPDDELGGRAAFEEAIREIRARGGFISLYANGNLVDRTTGYAAEHAQAVAKKDERGLEHVAGYAFAGESRTLRHFSAGSFVIACHGSPEWRRTMAGVARTHGSLGTASIFFDQTAYHLAAWPCFDDSHEHGARTGDEARFRRRTLEEIRTAAGAAGVGSEGMSDCMIPVLNFHHGWGFAFQDEPEAFPALFRTVFPEPVVSNRLLHDERPGWEDQLNYAFVHNLTFDVAIHRCRATVGAVPAYARRLARLIALRRAHRRFFSAGAFELVADAGPVLHARYHLGDAALDVRWNRGDAPVDQGDGVVAPHDVAVLVAERAAR